MVFHPGAMIPTARFPYCLSSAAPAWVLPSGLAQPGSFRAKLGGGFKHGHGQSLARSGSLSWKRGY